MSSGHEDLSLVDVDVTVGDFLRAQQLGQSVSLADLKRKLVLMNVDSKRVDVQIVNINILLIYSDFNYCGLGWKMLFPFKHFPHHFRG